MKRANEKKKKKKRKSKKKTWFNLQYLKNKFKDFLKNSEKIIC